MRNQNYAPFILLTAIVLLLTACSPTATPTPPAAPEASSAETTTTSLPAEADTLDGEALVQERCTECHSLTRVKNTGRTAEGWQAVVEEMIREGAVLNPDEKAAVLEYLIKTYPK